MDLIVGESEIRTQISLEKLRRLRASSPFAPVSEEVLIEFIKYYANQGNLPDALAMLRTFLNVNRTNSHRNTIVSMVVTKIEAQIRRDYEAKRYFEMLGLYELAAPVITGEQSYEADIAYLVARAYLELGLYDYAYRAVSEAFFVEGSTRRLSDSALLLLAEIQRNQGKFADVLRTLTFLRQRTDSKDALRRAALEEARMFEGQGNTDLAVFAYSHYAALEPNLLRKASSLARAGMLVAEKDGCIKGLPFLKQASAFARQASTDDERGELGNVFYQMGECLFSLERYNEAGDSFLTALSWKPNHHLATFARYSLGRAYLEQDRIKEAHLVFEAMARDKEASPKDPWLRMGEQALEQIDWRQSLVAID